MACIEPDGPKLSRAQAVSQRLGLMVRLLTLALATAFAQTLLHFCAPSPIARSRRSPAFRLEQDSQHPEADFEASPGLLLLDGLTKICNEDTFADFEKAAKDEGYGCSFLRMARATLLLLMDVLGVGKERTWRLRSACGAPPSLLSVPDAGAHRLWFPTPPVLAQPKKAAPSFTVSFSQTRRTSFSLRYAPASL